MKAMYIKEPGQVEFTEVDKPVRKKGEVLLKLRWGYLKRLSLLLRHLHTLIIRGFPAMNFQRKSLRQTRIMNRGCGRE